MAQKKYFDAINATQNKTQQIDNYSFWKIKKNTLNEIFAEMFIVGSFWAVFMI